MEAKGRDLTRPGAESPREIWMNGTEQIHDVEGQRTLTLTDRESALVAEALVAYMVDAFSWPRPLVREYMDLHQRFS